MYIYKKSPRGILGKLKQLWLTELFINQLYSPASSYFSISGWGFLSSSHTTGLCGICTGLYLFFKVRLSEDRRTLVTQSALGKCWKMFRNAKGQLTSDLLPGQRRGHGGNTKPVNRDGRMKITKVLIDRSEWTNTASLKNKHTLDFLRLKLDFSVFVKRLSKVVSPMC